MSKQKEWDYEVGLEALDTQLAGSGVRSAFEQLASALRQNLSQEHLFGSSTSAQVEERMQIVSTLNQLAFEHLGISFNALCLVEIQRTRAVPELGMDHQQGLAQLQVALPRDTSKVFEDYWDLEHRWWVNFTKEMLYGQTVDRRHERAELVFALNRMALAYAGRSFNDLCV